MGALSPKGEGLTVSCPLSESGSEKLNQPRAACGHPGCSRSPGVLTEQQGLSAGHHLTSGKTGFRWKTPTD